jgi:cyclohexa-1,5-dienecarbonyl-CoA hydratase
VASAPFTCKYESIDARLADDGRVLAITLDRPKGNILTMQMMDELRDALAQHREDTSLRMVLVRGAGGCFSYGASVAEHRRDAAESMLQAFHDLVRDIVTFPVPIAALVDGKCLGGAFEVALACHFVFATPSAVFACPEIKLGVLPPVLAVLGHLRLGAPTAERMLLTGEELDASRAYALGFVSAIVPSNGDAEHFVLDWYRRSLAPLSAFTLREATYAARCGNGMLAAIEAPLDAAERRYVERLIPSHDANEGIEAFLAKRAPQWVDA